MSLSLLFLLADSRFPSGAHAQSAGVEAALAAGDLATLDELDRYLQGRLATTGLMDAAFAAAACRAAHHAERRAILEVLDHEYQARVISPRLRAVDRRLGRQLLRTVRAGWTHPGLEDLSRSEGSSQCVVWGVAVAAGGGDPGDAAHLVLHHLIGAVTSSAIRLLGLDPFAVVGLQVKTAPLVSRLAASAEHAAQGPPAGLPAVGGAMTDLLGEHHGTWSSRLFVA